MTELKCWCGNKEFEEFSPNYKKCEKCGTLVCTTMPPAVKSSDKEKTADFYGRDYWFEFQPGLYDYPDLSIRSRQDLSERALYWLQSVLTYTLPPAKILELGSGHGGFVAMLRQAGFDASGLELSPWVATYAEEHFEVPMYVGPIEDQDINPGSFDLIMMFDVLEHFPSPLETITHCMTLLKPNGALLIQTPDFQKEYIYPELKKSNHRFLEQLKPNEHVYLFSKHSIKTFFKKIGVKNLIFLTPFFSYDMYLIASKKLLRENSTEEIVDAVQTTPGGRIIQAFLDLNSKQEKIKVQLDESDRDRTSRLNVINELERRLIESDRDRTERLKNIQILEEKLIEVESDRAARLDRIDELDTQIREIEKDRSSRLTMINDLGKQLEESEKDRTARLDVINEISQRIELIEKDRQKLEVLLKESEADRKARLNSINELEKLLKESEADRDARLESINELEKRLTESETDRKARLNSIDELEKLLKEHEDDQAARLEIIDNLEEVIEQHESEKSKLEKGIHRLEKELKELKESED